MADGEMDRSVREAAARSPELAALLARKRGDPSGPYRRLVVLAVGGALAVGLLWMAASSVWGRRAGKPSEPAEPIDTSHYLSPIKTAVAGPGEETAPFSGFAISVDTDPPGGLVTIAGVPRGEAPVLANVECTPGAPLEVRAERAGFPPAVRNTTCRSDALLKLTIRLGSR